jgi:hypothetical protein
MAAGLGFKTFTTGEVLTAADTNGYLMQGVLVFASAAARDAAITSPQEGQFAYLKDTNVTTYYTGSAWANLDTTGMTNPMTTTGDVIYSSPGSTPVRLGIGSTGNVLTVSGGVPVWSAPAGGGKVLQVVSGSTTTSVTNSTNTFADTTLTATITPTLATSKILVLIAQNGLYKSAGNSANRMTIKLNRAGSDILTIQSGVGNTGSALVLQPGSAALSYLDSPATTSATTYKTRFMNDANAALVGVQIDNVETSTITLMEIGV